MNGTALRSRSTVAGLAALGLLVSWVPADAYKMEQPFNGSFCSATLTGRLTSMCQVDCTNAAGFVHWTNRSIPWFLNTAGPGFDKQAAIQAALSSWSTVPNSTYSPFYAGTTTASGFTFDFQNTMSWGDADAICNPSLCHAITGIYVGSGEVLYDVDILFNSSSTLHLDWRTDGASDPCSPVYAGNRVDTQAIATHELGHSLGIHHPFTWESSFPTATMGAASCSADGRSLESDDQAALVCSDNRYPQNPSYDGYDEVTNCQSISGWAWNANRPNLSAYVDILDGSQVILDLEAGYFRSDLLYAGKGNGAHGYSVATPGQLKDGQLHSVSARFSGTGADLHWSPRTLACSAHMFSYMVPAQVLSTNNQVYTVATQFSSSQNGIVNQLWYYKAAGESGTDTIRLWTDGGALLASADLSGCEPGVYGRWCIAPISPVAITAGARYRVGINTNLFQSKTDCGIGSGITSGPLTAIGSFWIAGDTFPTTGSCSNFFVDVNFDM
jgi:hypothetical protein